MEDTKFKKTTLGDDALIYQRSKDTITKEEIKKLPFRQRIGYFRDYYLKIVLVVVLAAVLIGYLLNTTVFNRAECVLAICCLNDSGLTGSEDMDRFLEEYIGMEGKNDYIQTEAFYLDNYQVSMAFTTRIAAGAIDLVICSYDDFLEQSGHGMFRDLSEFLPADMYARLSDRFLENSVVEYDTSGEIVSHTEPFPFGIDLSDSSAYKEYGGLGSRPVLCVAANVQNTENVQKAISWFFSLDGEQ